MKKIAQEDTIFVKSLSVVYGAHEALSAFLHEDCKWKRANEQFGEQLYHLQ